MANLIEYVCRDCGEIIAEDEVFRFYDEPHYELDGCPVERYAIMRCPYCNSESVERL